MIAGNVETASDIAVRKRFYRPELDALRFLAFLAVLVHHGPAPPRIREAGEYGLSIFFFLSSYLITELLVREREQSGTVAWKMFFARRALRIWPLYYAALAAGVVIAAIPPHSFWIEPIGIAGMFFFVVNWVHDSFGKIANIGAILGPLWSISVEEQFYLVWPPVVKAGGKKLVFVASVFFVVSAAVWMWIFAAKGAWLLWYDTPVQFLFFGAGAAVALATHRKDVNSMTLLYRVVLLTAGLLCLAAASRLLAFGPSGVVASLIHFRLYSGFGAAATGCAAVFLAVLGVPDVPRVLTYLGKISYGLYVFHGGMLAFAEWLTTPLSLSRSSFTAMLVVDGIALPLCVLAAHFSYRYLEKPFLRLKEQFEVVKSRPA